MKSILHYDDDGTTIAGIEMVAETVDDTFALDLLRHTVVPYRPSRDNRQHAQARRVHTGDYLIPCEEWNKKKLTFSVCHLRAARSTA